MKVEATKRGYYGKLREPGESFALRSDKHFSKKWMKRLEPAKPEPKPAEAKPATPAEKPAKQSNGKS